MLAALILSSPFFPFCDVSGTWFTETTVVPGTPYTIECTDNVDHGLFTFYEFGNPENSGQVATADLGGACGDQTFTMPMSEPGDYVVMGWLYACDKCPRERMPMKVVTVD
jgi:hypothetical protein